MRTIELKSRFVILHFFNPVRYMRLLELSGGPDTDPAVVARMARFGEFLGKGIVYAKDTPNFVANRIGVFAMMLTLHKLVESGLGIALHQLTYDSRIHGAIRLPGSRHRYPNAAQRFSHRRAPWIPGPVSIATCFPLVALA